MMDRSNQGTALDVLLFNDEPIITSADNGALNISQGELNNKFIGQFSLAATDWKPATGASVLSVNLSSLPVKLKNGSTGVWGVMRSRGTPTYTGTNDLQLGITFRTF